MLMGRVGDLKIVICAPPLQDRDWTNICVVMMEVLVNGLGQDLGNMVVESSLTTLGQPKKASG